MPSAIPDEAILRAHQFHVEVIFRRERFRVLARSWQFPECCATAFRLSPPSPAMRTEEYEPRDRPAHSALDDSMGSPAVLSERCGSEI